MVNLFAYFFISLISLLALSAIVTVLISQKIKLSTPKFGNLSLKPQPILTVHSTFGELGLV